MDNIELAHKRIKLESNMVDILRFKVEALENLLKNHIPNFEEQYDRAFVLAEHKVKKSQEEIRDRQSD